MKASCWFYTYVLITGGGATLSLYLYLLAEYRASIGVLLVVLLISLPAIKIKEK